MNIEKKYALVIFYFIITIMSRTATITPQLASKEPKLDISGGHEITVFLGGTTHLVAVMTSGRLPLKTTCTESVEFIFS